MNEDKIKSNISYLYLFKKLWPYGKGCRFYLWLALTCVGLQTLCSRLLPTIIGKAIDEGILKSDKSALIQYAFYFLSAEIVMSLSMWLYLVYFQKYGNRVLYSIREHLIKHIQSLPLEYFNKTPTGRIVTRATNDVANLGDLFTEGVVAVFAEGLKLVSILIAMCLISVKLTLATLFLAPIFIWLSFHLSDRVKELYRASKKKLSELNSYVAENINGIKVIQISNRVYKNRKKFEMHSNEFKELNLASIRAFALLVPVLNVFTAFTITIALAWGGYLNLQGSLAIGMLVAFIMHAQDFMPPLREILDKYQQFQNSLTSAERVFQMFDERAEQNDSNPSQFACKGSIQIKDLNFRYQPDLPWVLKDINIDIKAGESIALIGRTGSGKSTFVSLLQRFYNLPKKTIFIDQVPIENLALEDLRSIIGVVLQDNFIFRGTIRDNISLCEHQISKEDIERACEQVGYHKLLEKSGRTLDSWVEERGANLSVGERQLLAFARILAFQPKILILDEATANVDSYTEQLIHQATQKVIKGRTSLIIAHRLSTIQECDRILVLDQGKIIEQGSHNELMKLKSHYYSLQHASDQT